MSQGFVSELFISFQGEGAHAGRRHLFVRLAGCNLRCRYCDTPESLQRVETCTVRGRSGTLRPIRNPLDAGQLVDLACCLLEEGGPVDAIALTGGEPLLQSDFLGEVLESRALPHPRLLETNGMYPDRLPALLPQLDIVSMDIKLPSNTGEPPFWEEHARFLQAARGKVYVKILVDRGTRLDELKRGARLVSSQAPGSAVFLQPIVDAAGKIDLDLAGMDRFFLAVKEELADVRLIPQLHKALAIP